MTATRMSEAARIPDDVYVMGRTDGEHERLRLQAKLLEPLAASVLEKAGIGPGMRCLDVGCGPAAVMRLMAERAGPTGKVVGLDVDRQLGEESVAALVRSGLRQCAFIEGDIREVEHIQGEPFDIVYGRLFLIHQQDPVAVLRKMYGWIKPGGTIISQEYYFEPMASYPETSVHSELRDLLFGTCRATGKDPATAIKLPQFYAAAGIGMPDGTDVAGHFLPRDVSMAMMRAGYRSVLPQALKQALVTEKEVESYFRAIEEVEPESYTLWPIMISAWKRKPA